MRAGRVERFLAALALAACAAGAGAAELATLFHTPQERARLDRLRRGESPQTVAAPGGEPELTGYVQRSDGRNTVWIDGMPVPVADPKAAPLFDPRAVRNYGESGNGSLRIERKDPVKR